MNKYVKISLGIALLIALVAWVVIPRLGGETETKTVKGQGNASRGKLPVTGIVAQHSMTTNGVPVTGSMLANSERLESRHRCNSEHSYSRPTKGSVITHYFFAKILFLPKPTKEYYASLYFIS